MADDHREQLRRIREVITSSQALAVRLADLARAIRRRINAALDVETDNGRLRKLMKAFRESLIHDLREDDFADMYAQTIAYGLLSARVSRPAGLAAEDMVLMIPSTNPFLKELMETLLHVGGRKREANGELPDFDELGINEIIDTLRDADMEAVLRDFDNRNPQEDPVIHFYELFLKEYDPKRRMQRGVFYTPKPVVSYIVRSVHEILQTEFGLEDGLASTVTWREMAERFPAGPSSEAREGRGEDNRHEPLTGIRVPEGTDPDSPFVTILDPATGTATFLVEVIDLIHRTLTERWNRQGRSEAQQAAAWNEYVPKQLLPRLHGYELMMAPYAMAHMKIGLKLAETGYRFDTEERARIYLTNALEPPSDDRQGSFADWAPVLAHEAHAVNEVKRCQRFTVVMGNPPYSGVSSNMNHWIDALLKGRLPECGGDKSYYEVDGRPLGEKKLWLQDDYVKFIRYGQWMIDLSGIGVLGYISNHGYLDNPTFRGMRQCLCATFPRIATTDLHGNTKKSEVSPDGSADENVFDIEQGVAVGMMWRGPSSSMATVHHSDVWGDRERKYRVLLGNTVSRLASTQLSPSSPFYLYVPFDDTHRGEYEAGWKLTDVMPVNVTGMVTARDHFVIDLDRAALLERIAAFRSSISDEDIRSLYFAGRTRSKKYPDGDSRGWKLAQARQRVRRDDLWETRAKRCLYRPFDKRWVYYVDWMVDWSRHDLMRHMLAGENVGLIARRQMLGTNLTYFLATDCIISDGVIRSDNKGSESLFPLYLYPEPGGLLATAGREVNLKQDYVRAISAATGLQWDERGRADLQSAFGPEDVLHFIYAQFFSPSYRERYADLLRMDFPRVFIPRSLGLFADLCRCGSDLIALHLFNSRYAAASWNQGLPGTYDPFETFSVDLAGEGPVEVAKGYPKFQQDRVYIHATRWFANVPEVVWEFRIGAHYVCQKWLKDRKGRTLSNDDVAHYQKIVAVLAETIRLMKEIDEVIDRHGGWPRAFVTEPRTEADEQENSALFA